MLKGSGGFSCTITSGDNTMLVLSRKKNESIVINNDITIVVVEIRSDKVRLGVDCPKEIPVHRREVYEAIQKSDADAIAVAAKEASFKKEHGIENCICKIVDFDWPSPTLKMRHDCPVHRIT